MMKKIIYVVTILLGIGLISTNFIIDDTSNIDHKTVKAGGTVCKWISESGYGYGPIYIDENYENNNIKSITTSKVYTEVDSNMIFNLFACNDDNVGDKKSGDLIYLQNGTFYSGYFGLRGEAFRSSSTTSNSDITNFVFKVEDGKISAYGYGSSTSFSISNIKYTVKKFNYPLQISILFNDTSSALMEDFINDNNDEVTYTCVCAEY